MIFTKETLDVQLTELANYYPDLDVISENDKSVTLSGNILVFICEMGFTIRKYYGIDIVISIGSDELPYVVDRDKYISSDYKHIYLSGKLCLETDTAIRFYFADGFNLLEWMRKFVEPYFFSYEYYMRYNIFPFGERSHGIDGVFQTYQEILHTKDAVETFQIMSYIDGCKKYRGHVLCPCGSKMKLRNCHGEYLFPIVANCIKRGIIINDYHLICEELKKYERNNEQTKRA